ncbi:MAG: hypothetical protein ACI8W8_001745 [Rhodothermales bacterium]|jgi:uncharacterized protein involved in response to NO
MQRAILASGFRIFFVLAAIHALVTMTFWSAILHFRPLGSLALSPVDWHAHEMIFGYGMAVVAGFLLTAVRNWTGLPTCNGLPLGGLAGLWIAARVLLLTGSVRGVQIAFVCDLIFQLLLLVAVLVPIVKARQGRHAAICIILIALIVCNILFYRGATRVATISGLYLLVGLILVMASRVLPFFTSKRVANYAAWRSIWLERLLAPVFIAFWICELRNLSSAAAACAGLLSLMLAIVLWGWYTHAIWRQPMLWVLHLAYGFIVLGFGLRAVSGTTLGLHALAAGGIGLMTVGMMIRVTLGHTGRDVSAPTRLVPWIFGSMTAAALLRVIGPLIWPGPFLAWIAVSQLFWAAAFVGFLVVLAGPLCQPRADGKPG